MKVFVNQEGELAIGEIILAHYMWTLFNGRERYHSPIAPTKWGWKEIGFL